MWPAITAVLQIIYLIFKNRFEKDAEEKEKKRLLYEEAKGAIASRDVSRINNVLGKLRQ